MGMDKPVTEGAESTELGKQESKKAAKKDAKKAEKAAKKAEHKANSAPVKPEGQEGNKIIIRCLVLYISSLLFTDDVSKGNYGVFPLIRSGNRIPLRKFVYINALNKDMANKDVWVRARLHTSRARGKQCFIVLRQREFTIQVIVNVSEKVSKQMVKFASG